MKRLAFIFAILSQIAFGQAWSGILDSSRAIDWSGVPFTITPATVQCGSTINGYGSSGSPGDPVTINNAITACTSGQYVHLSGTFWLSGGIVFNAKSGVTLRGDGPLSTIVHFANGFNCGGQTTDVCMVSSPAWYSGSAATQPGGSNACSWTAGYSKGTTSITLNSCGGAPPLNQTIILDQANDTSDTSGLYVCDIYQQCQITGAVNQDGRIIGGVTYSQQQVVKVTAVSGSGSGPYTVTISPGVYFNNVRVAQTPGAWWPGFVSNDGIENLTLDNSLSAANNSINYGTVFYDCYQCWITGVRDYKSRRGHVGIFQSAKVIVRNNYNYLSLSDATVSYGVEIEEASDVLIENNIFDQITAPIVVGQVSGMIAAYNYTTNNAYNSYNVMQGNTTSHNAGSSMNLWEGNSTNYITADDTFGTGPLATFFRNRIYGFAPSKTLQTNSLEADTYARGWNIIGNVLGTSGYHTNYEAATPTATNCATSIYVLGWSGFGCSTDAHVANDTLVKSTMMRWGNYDTVNAANRFNNTEASPGAVAYISANSVPGSQVLPNSFYLGTQPSYWSTPYGTPPWPAIGPDVTGGNDPSVGGHSNLIPSALCNTGLAVDTSFQNTYTVSAASWSGGLATITVSPTPSSILQGYYIPITGISPSGYNSATALVTAVSGNNITYFVTSNPGSYSSGGQILFPNVRSFDAGTCYPSSLSSAGLTPASVAFGTQTVSTSSSGQVVTLTNSGGTTLNIASIAFTGTNAADFSKTTTCGSTLNGGASCTITVTFTPAATGSRSANLVVTDDSGGVGGSTQTTTLTGTGTGTGWTLVQSVWNGSLASFGGTCSLTSATCTIDAGRSMVAITPGDLVVATLEQQGSSIAGCGSPSVISSIAGGGGTFVLPTSTQGYNPNHSSAIGYILSATAADTSATVTRSFGYSGAGCNFQVSLREFRPPTGATAALDITGTQASASGTSYNGVGLNLAGSNEVIVQAFSGGAGLASISSPYNSDFNSSDHDGSASVINTSSGTAPTITSAQAATAIASAAAFTTSFPRAATPVCTPSTGVYNSSQSVSCTDSTPSSFLCGSTDGSTPVTDGVSNCVGTAFLITGALTINVTTTLNVVGGCVGCSDSLVSNNVYTLTSAFASVSPTSLTFPSQATSTSSNIQNIVFTNVGAGGLQIASIGVTGDFSETDNCSRIQGLPSGASCTVSVTFTPTTTGARTGVLTFTDNSTGVIGTTQTVALSGTGVNPPNSGLSFKGNMTFRGNFSIRAQSVTPQTGAPLTYAARTDLTVFGTGATGELLPGACNGNISCLKNAYDSSATTGHQGAAMSYTGGPTSVPPPACRTGGTGAACASSGNNINGLASYLTGANTVNTDPDMGTTIIRATSAEFSGTVQCLGSGLFGSSFSMGTGSSNHWSVPDESGNRKLKVVTTGGSTSVLAFNPSTGQVTASDLCGGYFPGGASFSSTDAHIVYTSNADGQENTVPFSSKTGTFITPETINQAVTGAHATLLAINATFVQMGPATGGTADNSHVWTGASSGATFTPNSSFAAPGNNSTSPYAQTIYQGIICDGSAASEESVCLKNPTGTPCAANDTNPTCWYVYWSLVFNYNYVAAMAGDSHFPAASGNCLPAGFDANFNGVFSPSSDSTVFTVAYGDNGQSNHTGYNGGGNASTDNGYSCPNSPGGVCQGPVYLASYKVGSGCRVFNTMTDQITGDWGTTGQALDQQSFLIPGTVTGTPGPSNAWTQDTTGATTQLLCMRNSSNACATSGWTQAYTGLIYGGSASNCTNSGANASSVWRDSNGASLTPSGCPANAPFLYPDVIHDGSQFPNNQLLSYSLVQQPFIKPTGNTAVVYSASAHTSKINYTGGIYSPGQQFIFFNMAGAHDSYLNCISANSCPVFTAITVPNTGDAICPGNGPYCPSGANGTITVTDNLGGGSDYTDTESQVGCGKVCPVMQPAPQDQNLGAGGFGGQNYWQTQTVYTAADLKSSGHSASGEHTVVQGKDYTGIIALTPWLPATVSNSGSSNTACQKDGSPCGLIYPGSATPTPNSTNINLLPTTITDDQHGIWGFAPSDLTPPFFVTTLVCNQATTGGVGSAACESQYASVWDSEIVAIENALTRSSPGNLVGADCVYGATTGPVPCVYRIAHTFNSDSNWQFSGQNAIANGGITEDGVWIAFPSDWNLTLGCMDLSTTNCWSSWQSTAPNATGTGVTWTNDGSGNITINMPNQFCPKNGTQYWYVANPLPPAGNIQSIACGPTAGTVKLTGFSESWLNNQTLTLDVNTANAWGCDSTTSNAGNCTAFVLHNVAGATAGPGTETGTQKATPTGCGSGVPCQREDIWIAKITSAHQ